MPLFHYAHENGLARTTHVIAADADTTARDILWRRLGPGTISRTSYRLETLADEVLVDTPGATRAYALEVARLQLVLKERLS